MKVLCVCLGNICRSPMAEAILRHYSPTHAVIDSAGTSGWHNGETAHSGTLTLLREHQIDTSGLISRKINQYDFENFDLILAMDHNNLKDLKDIAPKQHHSKIRLFLESPTIPADEVPDPWFTGNFEETYALCLEGAKYWIEHIKSSSSND